MISTDKCRFAMSQNRAFLGNGLTLEVSLVSGCTSKRSRGSRISWDMNILFGYVPLPEIIMVSGIPHWIWLLRIQDCIHVWQLQLENPYHNPQNPHCKYCLHRTCHCHGEFEEPFFSLVACSWTCPNSTHFKLCLTALDLLSQPWEQGTSTHVDQRGVWQNHQCRWYCNPIEHLSLQEQDGPSQTSLALAILETWLHTPISCTCHSECALMYAWLDICDTHNCRACKHIFFQPDHIPGN